MPLLDLKLQLIPLAIKKINLFHKEKSYIVGLQIVKCWMSLFLSLNSEVTNFQKL